MQRLYDESDDDDAETSKAAEIVNNLIKMPLSHSMKRSSQKARTENVTRAAPTKIKKTEDDAINAFKDRLTLGKNIIFALYHTSTFIEKSSMRHNG